MIIFLGNGDDSEEAILCMGFYPKEVLIPEGDSEAATHSFILKAQIISYISKLIANQ